MESPFKKAFAQARFVVLGAVAVAVVYNLLASTGVPWIAKPADAKDGVATSADVLGTDTAAKPAAAPADTTAKPAAADTATTSPIAAVDTTAKPTTDTAGAADARRAKEIADSTLKAERIRKAEQMRRRQDSLDAIRNVQKPNNPPPANNGTVDAGGYKDIEDLAIVKEAFDKKAAVFVDARKPEDFAKGHIPGAINIYGEDEFARFIPTLLAYPKSTRVIVYCGGGLCELSHETAKNIATMRWFEKVFVFKGGTRDWLDAGYPFTGNGGK